MNQAGLLSGLCLQLAFLKIETMEGPHGFAHLPLDLAPVVDVALSFQDSIERSSSNIFHGAGKEIPGSSSTATHSVTVVFTFVFTVKKKTKTTLLVQLLEKGNANTSYQGLWLYLDARQWLLFEQETIKSTQMLVPYTIESQASWARQNTSLKMPIQSSRNFGMAIATGNVGVGVLWYKLSSIEMVDLPEFV
jgi:hypothetical protein